MKLRRHLALVAAAAVALAAFRGGAVRFRRHPTRGPELIVFRPHRHPESCATPIYYLLAYDCPILVRVSRSEVRWNFRELLPP